ncbi:heparinase [Nitratireductor mangrovi]|uniref:Heparinase n=1 Tax=Nitratireductor mangrovi TaxID=2599600 RepID=A0A5B8KW46_9HYPH|nr:heparinase II/III family protein [Nitratireductor mangrovi]QDY99936.1 heparinase [Nitratireductor mangrovi]
MPLATATGQSPRLWGLVAREIWRRARQKLRTAPAYRWRYAGRTPERVLIAPPDLRLADPQIATEIYHGRFPLAGRLVETGGRSPFAVEGASAAWLESLHGFRWLRHLREAGTELAAANARALVGDWIETHGMHISGVAWEPAVVARRVIAWLQHSTIVLQGAEFQFYRDFLRSLITQIRYLRAMCQHMPGGEERLRARISLAFAALSLPTAPSVLRNATRHLARELEHQILPDGGHISRRPAAVMEILADLLPLRQTYANQAEVPPPALIGAIDRMLPALRFFRHQDGNLARFNGMGATVPDRIVAILRHDDTEGKPLLHAPHSGFERLTMGDTTVIADTGAPREPEAAAGAHAGCLSFELSSGRRMFVVNAGVDKYGPEDFRPLSRATAAHSTATLNDTSSCRFSASPRLKGLIGAAVISGPREVRVERRDGDGAQGFTASHDGYGAPFGIVHERQLALSHDGDVLDGTDRFRRPDGLPVAPGAKDQVAVRFHVHPDIDLLRDDTGRLVLNARDGHAWVFSCDGVMPSVEESIFFAGISGPRRNLQIVLSFRASELGELAWRLTRTDIDRI